MEHLDLFIAYTDLYPILIDRTYYLMSSRDVSSYSIRSGGFRFIKIEFALNSSGITSAETYADLRDRTEDRSTLYSVKKLICFPVSESEFDLDPVSESEFDLDPI